jgi:hypothetical protein
MVITISMAMIGYCTVTAAVLVMTLVHLRDCASAVHEDRCLNVLQYAYMQPTYMCVAV